MAMESSNILTSLRRASWIDTRILRAMTIPKMLKLLLCFEYTIRQCVYHFKRQVASTDTNVQTEIQILFPKVGKNTTLLLFTCGKRYGLHVKQVEGRIQLVGNPEMPALQLTDFLPGGHGLVDWAPRLSLSLPKKPPRVKTTLQKLPSHPADQNVVTDGDTPLFLSTYQADQSEHGTLILSLVQASATRSPPLSALPSPPSGLMGLQQQQPHLNPAELALSPRSAFLSELEFVSELGIPLATTGHLLFLSRNPDTTINQAEKSFQTYASNTALDIRWDSEGTHALVIMRSVKDAHVILCQYEAVIEEGPGANTDELGFTLAPASPPYEGPWIRTSAQHAFRQLHSQTIFATWNVFADGVPPLVVRDVPEEIPLTILVGAFDGMPLDAVFVLTHPPPAKTIDVFLNLKTQQAALDALRMGDLEMHSDGRTYRCFIEVSVPLTTLYLKDCTVKEHDSSELQKEDSQANGWEVTARYPLHYSGGATSATAISPLRRRWESVQMGDCTGSTSSCTSSAIASRSLTPGSNLRYAAQPYIPQVSDLTGTTLPSANHRVRSVHQQSLPNRHQPQQVRILKHQAWVPTYLAQQMKPNVPSPTSTSFIPTQESPLPPTYQDGIHSSNHEPHSFLQPVSVFPSATTGAPPPPSYSQPPPYGISLSTTPSTLGNRADQQQSPFPFTTNHIPFDPIFSSSHQQLQRSPFPSGPTVTVIGINPQKPVPSTQPQRSAPPPPDYQTTIHSRTSSLGSHAPLSGLNFQSSAPPDTHL